MEINLRSLLTRLRTAARVSIAMAVLLAGFNGTAWAQGTTGLLGVSPGFPQVDGAGSGQTCSYDSGSMTLTLMALTNSYLPDPNNFENISNGMITITAELDASGNPVNGTGKLTINGTTSSGLTDPLLTGDIVGIGLQDTNNSATLATDRADVRATPTGGSIFNGPDWPAGFDITASLFLTGSDYAGSVATSWSCQTANMTIGAEFFPAPPPQDIVVDIDVLPGSDPDCIRINGNGVVPVAILGSAGFDVSLIDQSTLIFQGLEVGTRGGTADPDCSPDDVNGDGETDLLCNFQDDLDNWVTPDADNIATLWGSLDDSTPITGAEEICLVSKKKSKALSPYALLVLVPVALVRRRLRKARGC